MSEDRLEKLVESNAKSIQALSDAVARDCEAFNQERKEWAQDRRRVFEWMARLAAAQADFYEMQADHLSHLDRIDDRLTDILDRLTPKPDQ
ncbi:hypothetical protein [Chroococcus sp. FPU101]|uniref:hypothetical protein n=1 Tax=Chroococcus sp. FPU101 TaxID=1974212 RepID=UPI001A8E1ACC|nr:hypothetical protein [Chroococcus sp. FPU101]GFE70082.1 hypothetical protein CFPU101_26920 [Chroococcus sp. FPU101]